MKKKTISRQLQQQREHLARGLCRQCGEPQFVVEGKTHAFCRRHVEERRKRLGWKGLSHTGLFKALRDLSEAHGVNFHTLYFRLKRGRTVEEAVMPPYSLPRAPYGGKGAR